jgi:hypothetical protein
MFADQSLPPLNPTSPDLPTCALMLMDLHVTMDHGRASIYDMPVCGQDCSNVHLCVHKHETRQVSCGNTCSVLCAGERLLCKQHPATAPGPLLLLQGRQQAGGSLQSFERVLPD